MDCIEKIHAIGSFFLSRFKNNTCVYLQRGDVTELDLAKHLNENFRHRNVVDIDVFITKSKVPVRLVAYKVPPEISAERRRNAHATAKKQGRTLTRKKFNLT